MRISIVLYTTPQNMYFNKHVINTVPEVTLRDVDRYEEEEEEEEGGGEG